MWKFNFFLLCIVISLSQQLHGQVLKPEKIHIIPFQLTEYNNLSVEAILNEKDTVNLMFHTAANAVTLTEEAVKKIKSLRFAGADSVKSWGGEGNSSRFSKSNTLQIGDLKWENMPIWENKNSGPKTDGKFGIDLFENKVIELDFEKRLITLHTSLPGKSMNYEKLKLIVENDNLFIEASCQIGQTVVKNKFLIHSGYSGDVLFDDKFVSENKFDEKLSVISEKELKDSFGNSVKTKKAILPVFQLGNEKLSDVPVGFFKGAIGRQKMSIVGGDILKRFNILIDEKREYIYLKANDLIKTNYTNS